MNLLERFPKCTPNADDEAFFLSANVLGIRIDKEQRIMEVKCNDCS